MLDYQECARLVASARDKRSKPVANNTRVERRGDSAYALKLHATDIATFYEDGRIEINSGGYRTVTTAQRLDSMVTRHRYSERGTWYVRAEPGESDPEPIRGERTIPKPFHALDPGPEPVRDDSVPEHIADTETIETVSREIFIREGERRDDDVTIEHLDGYFSSRVRRNVTVATYWREQRYSYQFGAQPPTEYPDADEHKSEQCPHCAHHDRVHGAWDLAMHGEHWGRNRGKGYEQMSEMLEQFGTREAWQEAYLDDFREAREANAAHKAWVERNRVLFEDHMEITAEGYAKRPDLKEVARQAKELKSVKKKRDRIDAFVKRAVAALDEGQVAMPGSGDCWGCLFRADDRSVEPMGVDHLDQHIDDDYFVPSMFVNALRNSGYHDTGIYIHLGMDPEAGTMGNRSAGGSDLVARALRKYLYQRLIPEHAAR